MSWTLKTLNDIQEPLHVVELAALLLRRCRAEAGALYDLFSDIERLRHMERLSNHVRDWFVCFDDEVLMSDDARALSEHLAGGTGDLPDIGVTRALVEGLDDALGPQFFRYFRCRRSPLVCSPGDPVPVPRANLRGWYSRGKLTPRPESLGFRPDRVKHLALVPEDTKGLEVTVDARYDDELARLCDLPLRVAVVLPNAVASEIHVEEVPGADAFFGVRPKDPEQQTHRLLSLLDTAERAGAIYAVAPELSTTPEIVDELEQWMRLPERRLRLLVAGSFHEERGNRRRNVAVTLTRNGARWEHEKFNAYVHKTGDRALREAIHREDGRSGVVLQVSNRCALSTLICKDLLDIDGCRLIADLAVTLLFVPSWSPETYLFVAKGHQLVAEAQASMFVACMHDGEADVAIAAAPREEAPVVTMKRSAVEPPVALLYAAAEEPKWRRLVD